MAKISDSEVMRALIDYFKEGGRPFDIVPLICDAWESALFDLNEQGNHQLSKLLDAKRI